MKEHKITLSEIGRSVYALGGTSLFECLARAGVMLRTPCGGAGTCGKCLVQVVDGVAEPSKECLRHLGEAKVSQGYRLACRCRVSGDISVIAPKESLFDSDTVALGAHSSVLSGDKDGDTACALVSVRDFDLSCPTMDDPVSDLDNLLAQAGDVEVPLGVLRDVPEVLREGDFSVSCAMTAGRIISIWPRKPGVASAGNYGIAIDLGTTTIAAALMDIASGEQLACRATLNPQVRFGDDVVSRVCAQAEGEKNLRELRECAVNACNGLIEELLADSSVPREKIFSVAVAGNTAMEAIMLGLPVRHMGQIPFAPPFSSGIRISGVEAGLAVHPAAEVVFFPVIGGFIGGDITAGIIASGLCSPTTVEGNILFVDVGTNGEIILKKGCELYAAAAAAGPAFEGAGISCGMRAGRGAIEKVIVEQGVLKYNVIGDAEPMGMCGSGLIDVAAELLKCGILDETGRIQSPEEYHFTHGGDPGASKLLEHLVPSEHSEGTWDFVIISESRGKKIMLTQKDVRNLQLAAGAIRAATNILLKTAGLECSQLGKIYIAGGFGNYIRRTHAKRIGMIPPLPDEEILFLGNTSLAGAKTALLSAERLDEAEKLSREVKFVDVSLDIEFQMEFASAMIFPCAGPGSL